MKNNDALKLMGCLSSSIHFMKSPLIRFAIEDYAQKEKLVQEIAILSGKTIQEIINFYDTHNYSLETIKLLVVKGDKILND